MTSLITRSIIFNHHSPISLFARPSSVCYFSQRPRPRPESLLYRPDKVEVIDDVQEKLRKEEMKYRKHPGVMKLPPRIVEPWITNCVRRVMIDAESVKVHRERGKEMEKFMDNRRLPMEEYDLLQIRQEMERRVRADEAKKGWTPETCETDEDRLALEEIVKKKIEHRVRTSVYTWKRQEYDSPSKCLTYCVNRFAPEYAALRRVFHEIVKREPAYKPRHVFDFGSGIGTVFFAAQTAWPRPTIEEYVGVEVSKEMNDLFHLLLRGGDPNGQPCHQNATVRPYLPAVSERKYDITVSAYSLFELPSYEERMRTVANLWDKTNDFLILIERGTNAGYRAILEARDYILAGGHEIHRKSLSETARRHANLNLTDIEIVLQDKTKTEAEKFSILRQKYPDVEFPTVVPHGHVFAPCPHDMGCPRSVDVTPCNFAVRYFQLRLSGKTRNIHTEVFSFIVMRKGYAPSQTDRWPRIVREPRKSKGCVWCQMCSPHGVLEDKSFVKGPMASERGIRFRLVKRSEWGDLLPVITSYDTAEEIETHATEDVQANEDSDQDEEDDSEYEDVELELSEADLEKIQKAIRDASDKK